MSMNTLRLGDAPLPLTFEATLGTADTKYVVVPERARLDKVWSVIDAALTTTQETIAFNNGATTMGTITIIKQGSAAGDIDSVEITSSNVFEKGTAVLITIGGENGAATKATLTFDFTLL